MNLTTIDEVIEQLNKIVIHSIQNNDRAGYFAALYKQVTIAVAKKIKEGYFDDNERMEKLDVVFANRYLDAYEKYYKKSECSACWKLAFDTAKTWRPMVIHHLLAGMNAHISLDLGIAAATVSQGKPINDIQNDFNKINTILKELTDNVKSDLFDMWPLSKFLTGLKTDKLENEMAAFSMTIARDAAWQVALNYSALTNDSDKEKFIAERDRKVTEFGKKILYFKFWQSMLATIFRIFETGSISSKIAKLDN